MLFRYLEGNPVLCEKLLRLLVPGLFQAFVQGEQVQGSAGSAGKFRPVKVEIQVKSLHVFRCKGKVFLFQKPDGVRPGKGKDKPEIQRGAFPPDKGKTVFPLFLPEGELPVGSLLFSCLMEEFFVKPSVNVELTERGNFSFYQKKGIEDGRPQKGIHACPGLRLKDFHESSLLVIYSAVPFKERQ